MCALLNVRVVRAKWVRRLAVDTACLCIRMSRYTTANTLAKIQGKDIRTMKKHLVRRADAILQVGKKQLPTFLLEPAPNERS